MVSEHKGPFEIEVPPFIDHLEWIWGPDGTDFNRLQKRMDERLVLTWRYKDAPQSRAVRHSTSNPDLPLAKRSVVLVLGVGPSVKKKDETAVDNLALLVTRVRDWCSTFHEPDPESLLGYIDRIYKSLARGHPELMMRNRILRASLAEDRAGHEQFLANVMKRASVSLAEVLKTVEIWLDIKANRPNFGSITVNRLIEVTVTWFKKHYEAECWSEVDAWAAKAYHKYKKDPPAAADPDI